jgi:hypothetical protein
MPVKKYIAIFKDFYSNSSRNFSLGRLSSEGGVADGCFLPATLFGGCGKVGN